jgi:hypothetical protein
VHDPLQIAAQGLTWPLGNLPHTKAMFPRGEM